jgi:hypothetical protein
MAGHGLLPRGRASITDVGVTGIIETVTAYAATGKSTKDRRIIGGSFVRIVEVRISRQPRACPQGPPYRHSRRYPCSHPLRPRRAGRQR